MDMMSYLLGKTGGGAKGLKVEVVEELPATGEANVLYLVPKEDEGDNDIFDEWLYIEEEWEHIGSTDIDLSGYEQITNKITTLNAQSTDTQYPSAKAVYDYVGGAIPPVGLININNRNFNNITYWDNDTTIKNIRTTGAYYLYENESIKGVVGIMFVWNFLGIAIQSLYLFHEPTFATRMVPRQGTITPNFSDNCLFINNTDITQQPTIDSTNNVVIKSKYLYSYYGSKTIADLTTTNKTSIVDAINEVNTKINNLVDANNTSY